MILVPLFYLGLIRCKIRVFYTKLNFYYIYIQIIIPKLGASFLRLEILFFDSKQLCGDGGRNVSAGVVAD